MNILYRTRSTHKMNILSKIFNWAGTSMSELIVTICSSFPPSEDSWEPALLSRMGKLCIFGSGGLLPSDAEDL